VLHPAELAVDYGKAIVLRGGLTEAGYSGRVVSVPFVVPLDEEAIHAAVTETGVVLTVEEHGVEGLGAAVGECIARFGHAAHFLAPAPRTLSHDDIWNSGQLRELQGLSVPNMTKSAEDLPTTLHHFPKARKSGYEPARAQD
jgi:transketolase